MRYPKAHINQKKLKKFLKYDPDTGWFTALTDSPTGRVKAGFVYKPRRWDSYITLRVDNIQYKAHRLAWVYMTGEQPDIIDHINGLRHDNRFVNLRSGTYADNSKNGKMHRKKEGRYITSPEEDFDPRDYV